MSYKAEAYESEALSNRRLSEARGAIRRLIKTAAAMPEASSHCSDDNDDNDDNVDDDTALSTAACLLREAVDCCAMGVITPLTEHPLSISPGGGLLEELTAWWRDRQSGSMPPQSGSSMARIDPTVIDTVLDLVASAMQAKAMAKESNKSLAEVTRLYNGIKDLTLTLIGGN